MPSARLVTTKMRSGEFDVSKWSCNTRALTKTANDALTIASALSSDVMPKGRSLSLSNSSAAAPSRAHKAPNVSEPTAALKRRLRAKSLALS